MRCMASPGEARGHDPQTVEDAEKMTLAEIQQLRAAMKIDGRS